ncbi:MAG: DUF4443 domain-containing protein [Candidatus Thermoplasmatota archaeon]|nr:DUF4443 domain-containing protein [Candidatus Thermoplasmatota archaeon]
MKGALPKFTNVHLWKTLREIYLTQTIGRKRLASQVGVGEGTIRTILKYFKAKDFVVIEQVGIKLSEKGKKIFEKYRLQTTALEKSGLTVGKYNCAVIVKNKASKIKLGIEQRDEAIKAGATGTTTLVYKNNVLSFPGEAQALDQSYPKISALIISKFNPENNDVIIIGSGMSLKKAEEGALAAALELVKFKI